MKTQQLKLKEGEEEDRIIDNVRSDSTSDESTTASEDEDEDQPILPAAAILLSPSRQQQPLTATPHRNASILHNVTAYSELSFNDHYDINMINKTTNNSMNATNPNFMSFNSPIEYNNSYSNAIRNNATTIDNTFNNNNKYDKLISNKSGGVVGLSQTTTSDILHSIAIPNSPRTAYLVGCARANVLPKPSLIIRKVLTKELNLQHQGK